MFTPYLLPAAFMKSMYLCIATDGNTLTVCKTVVNVYGEMLTGLTKLERLNVGWCNCIKNRDMKALSGKMANVLMHYILLIALNLSFQSTYRLPICLCLTNK